MKFEIIKAYATVLEHVRPRRRGGIVTNGSVLGQTAKGMTDMVRLIEALAERGVSITHIRQTLQRPEVLDRLAEDLRLAEDKERERLRMMAQVSDGVDSKVLRSILDAVEPGMADRYGTPEMFRLLLGGKATLRWQAAAICLYFCLNGQKMAKADIARELSVGTSSVAEWLNGGSRSYIRTLRDRDRELRFGSLHPYLPVRMVGSLSKRQIACPLDLYHYYVRGTWREEWDDCRDQEVIEGAISKLLSVD